MRLRSFGAKFLLLFQLRMVDDVGQSVGPEYSGEPGPISLCAQQISYNLAWAQTRAAAVGRRTFLFSRVMPV
jgi:hypothetical protein